MHNRSLLERRRAARLQLLATTLLLSLAATGCPYPPPPNPDPITTTLSTLDCQGTAMGESATVSIPTTARVEAPRTVASGSNADISISLGTFTVPKTVLVGSYGNQTVSSMTDVTIAVVVPAEAAIQAFSATGGTVGEPYVTERAGTVSVYVAGPMYGGSQITLPTLELTLKAVGAVGTIVGPRFSGSTYADPTATLTTSITASVGSASVPTRCFMSPNPLLSSTLVVAS